MLLGQGLKLVIQAIYFTVIARSLGASKYGAFVGVVGLVGILFPFATLGSGYLLIRNVARDKNTFSTSWGTALATTAATSSALLAIVVLFSHLILPLTIPMRLVVLVAASDLYGLNTIGICGQAFLAFDRLQWTAWINVLLSATRLIGAVILAVFYNAPSSLQWGEYYCASTAAVAATALLLVFVKLGAPAFGRTRIFAEVREGLYFSVSQSAQTIYNDIDKTMLARLGTLEATGIYGAAYRIIDVSFTPVSSLLAAAYANLFRVGARGIAASAQYAKPLIMRSLGYSTLVSFALLAGSGLVPRILGSGYDLTAEAIRWLAVLPIIKTVHYFLSDALAGAGHQGLRTLAHVSAAVFNILVNLWLIPSYSWRGAAWSSIASDAFLACAIGSIVLMLSRQARPEKTRREIIEMGVEV